MSKLTSEYIIILDDLEKWKSIVTNNLTYYGCNNIIYFKTKEEIITSYNPNTTIAFIDINLDTQDKQNREGLKVCKFFKQNVPKTTIVAMSSLENMANASRENGADFFIQKTNFVQDFNSFIKQYTRKT